MTLVQETLSIMGGITVLLAIVVVTAYIHYRKHGGTEID